MKTQAFSKAIELPSVDDVLAKYPRYTQLLAADGRLFFDLIMQPEAFVAAQVLSDFDLPAVLAIAEPCARAAEARSGDKRLDSFTKQFIGAAVCVLMEANGYKKTGKKKSVPHYAFSTGEFYKRG